jgi:hypothetical protein
MHTCTYPNPRPESEFMEAVHTARAATSWKSVAEAESHLSDLSAKALLITYLGLDICSTSPLPPSGKYRKNLLGLAYLFYG